MRILITGAGGMLGRDVHAAATAAGHEPIALGRAELDITDPHAVEQAVAAGRPDAVINCAAYTDVDGAESDAEQAMQVNGAAAGHVAACAARQGAWAIHVSSDYVFDGAKRTPYLESDERNPLSVYGSSKALGERHVAELAEPRHTIVRSSWLFGAAGPCFPATILRLAAERDQLSVVDDQVGCPTFTGHLAPALVELAETRPRGIVHLAADGQCSWHAFATEIVEVTGVSAEVRPIATADFPRPARRPAYSVLRSERSEEIPILPHWREGLAGYLSARVASA